MLGCWRGKDARETDAHLAGHRVSAWRHLGRIGHEFRPVLRGGRPGRAVPVRCRGRRDPDRAHRGRRVRLARLPAGSGAGDPVRVPRARPLRSGPRAPVQPRQAAARPVRQSGAGPGQLARIPVLLPLRRSCAAEHRGQCTAHAEERRDQPLLRLGGRQAAAHSVPRDGDLRGARAGPDAAPPRYARRSSGAPTAGWRIRR